jgi:hypothetical protein
MLLGLQHSTVWRCVPLPLPLKESVQVPLTSLLTMPRLLPQHTLPLLLLLRKLLPWTPCPSRPVSPSLATSASPPLLPTEQTAEAAANALRVRVA